MTNNFIVWNKHEVILGIKVSKNAERQTSYMKRLLRGVA